MRRRSRNAPLPEPALPGLALRPFEAQGTVTSKFELTLVFQETAQGLAGWVEYNTDLFEPATIARMAGHLQTLLEAAVARPEQKLAELSLLAEEERHQLLIAWNDTRTEYPREECLHGLFEAQAARTPQAVAVEFEGAHLTYAELDARANQLARHLGHLGVGPEVRVGICLERSLEMVVGLLGVLKAGGAYVPLDPAYPQERLAAMLEDAGAPVLLTQQRHLSMLPPSGAQVLCLDSGWEEVARQPTRRPSTSVTSDNLAYVIFTSGSTGKPKGAMNTHRAICNRLRWMQDAFGLHEEDRVLQKTPFGFDVSVWEFFWPLLTGARLVLARPGGHQDAAYLVNLIHERGITTLHFVPPMLHAFLEQPHLERCGSLSRVICSGEALPAELAARCLERLPARLHNLYGPTEAAVDVTWWECRPGQTTVFIGRPIANTRTYVLDARLEPVPAGVPGELYLGGVQVARGYLGRPEQTGERFIPDLFSDSPGARLYRTGDLVRWQAEGNLEYLGRLDNQVKLRGFRIELGEVESVLAQHPAVQQAVVLAREDRPGDKRLVAYVTGREGRPEAGVLRDFLRQKLPEYMVPSAFVALDALPLTPNGKVDRKALPAPDRTTAGSEVFVTPRDALELELVRIWEELLGVQPISVTGNFFELGGHSLLAVQLTARIRESTGEIPARQRVLFLHTGGTPGLFAYPDALRASR